MHIHIHLNVSKESLDFLTNKLNQMSDVLDNLNAKIDRIFSATTGVAGDLRSIKDQLKEGLTKEEAESLANRLDKAATALEALDAETPADEAPVTEE